jgi:hypothetical protein
MRDLQYRLPNGKTDFAMFEKAERKLSANLNAGTPPHKVRLPDAYMDRVAAHDQTVRQERSLEAEAWRRFNGSKIEQQPKAQKRNPGLWERFVRWVFE